MVDQIVVGVLTWFHVVSVIGWSGAALTFLIAIGPSLGKLSPQANGEFAVKALPRFVTTVQAFTVFTLVFGPLLAYTMNDGPPNAFDLVSPWSIFVTLGASVGITMLLFVFFFLTPTVKNLVRIVKQMQQNPQQPPPSGLGSVQKRMKYGGPLSVTLLLLAEVFMVTAAQF